MTWRQTGAMIAVICLALVMATGIAVGPQFLAMKAGEEEVKGVRIVPDRIEAERAAVGGKAVAQMQFFNGLAHAITIHEVRRSCGCLLPKLQIPAVVESNGCISFGVGLDIPDVGEKQVALSILWSEPGGQKGQLDVPVTLKGSALRAPYMQNAVNAITLKTPSVDTAAARRFELCTVEESGSEKWIRGATSENSQFELKVVDVTENPYVVGTVQRVYTMVATGRLTSVASNASTAQFTWTLRPCEIVKKVVPLTVRVELQPVFDVIPKKVRLSEGSLQADVFVLANMVDSGSLDVVKEKPEWLEVEILPRTKDTVTKVRVSARLEKTTRPAAGSVVFKTSRQDGATVSFDVSI